jgi:broad specificity phosphatase PhoE
MQSPTVLLVRHARPEPPIAGSPFTLDNERPLTPDGRMAAQVLAASLRSKAITSVYSSPYRRARETVEPIAAALGLSVRVLDGLRERRLAEAPLDEASFLDALRQSRRDPSFHLPGGESTGEVRDRAFAALDRIHNENDGGIAVAGTHGGLISIVRWTLGVAFAVEQALSEPMPAVYPLRHGRGGWEAGERW